MDPRWFYQNFLTDGLGFPLAAVSDDTLSLFLACVLLDTIAGQHRLDWLIEIAEESKRRNVSRVQVLDGMQRRISMQ